MTIDAQTIQSGRYCYKKQGKWHCQNCNRKYGKRKDAINCCIDKKKIFLGEK